MEKLKILNEMQPKHIEDFVPLMSVDTDELREYKTNLEKDKSIGADHPIYYFSNSLNVNSILQTLFNHFNCLFQSNVFLGFA